MREATGSTRAIYDALAAALGVQLVNLVYRHLATVPGCLEWAWSTVGDGFRAGTFERHAGTLSALGRSVPAGLGGSGISLSACGLADADAGGLRATLTAYNRANPMNAISLDVLSCALAAGRPAGPFVAPAGSAAELPDLLPMAPLDRLPTCTMTLLLTLADLANGAGTRIVPSLFRHMTAWPDLLRALSDWLAPLAAAGDIDALALRIQDAAARTGRELFDRLPRAGSGASLPDPATRAALLDTIAIFTPAICRMIVTGALLQSAIRP